MHSHQSYTLLHYQALSADVLNAQTLLGVGTWLLPLLFCYRLSHPAAELELELPMISCITSTISYLLSSELAAYFLSKRSLTCDFQSLLQPTLSLSHLLGTVMRCKVPSDFSPAQDPSSFPPSLSLHPHIFSN